MNNAFSIPPCIRAFFFVSLLLIVEGCTLAPKYVRPDAPIPNAYSTEETDALSQNVPWKEFFQDTTMQRIIETALVSNRDLRIALLNIEKTRAEYRIQRADILPTINAGGGAVTQHLPADMSATGVKGISRQYSATLGFSAFELDLFGRIRSLTDQALETYQSVEEDANTARLSLVAETAAVYLQLVADRELYDVTKSTAESREESYALIKRKFDTGVASDLDLAQAQALVDEANANLAAAATQTGKDENYLVLLMGAPMPVDLPEIRRLANVQSLPDVPAGLPSALLERRPDIRSSEHLLRGANANIGAARANFFPTISLTGDVGRLSASYGDLFHGSQRAWSFAPQITLPVFDTGRNIARLQVSEAERDMAVARYEKVIQTAFREVADALVQYGNIGAQLAAQESLVASTTRSYYHASAKYNAGTAGYLNVLDAQRSLYAAQSNLIAARLLRESNALTLYKSLGGGWK